MSRRIAPHTSPQIAASGSGASVSKDDPAAPAASSTQAPDSLVEERVNAAQTQPTAYRGSSSGEFKRAVVGPAVDTNLLVVEAEQWIARLPADDHHRRLLQLAALRRDPALLTGLLEMVRNQSG